MNRRWLCGDVWMDILPSFDHAQLGLKMALLSDRFDFLVDKHFDRKSELTIWRTNEIRKDKGRNANDNGPKAILSVWISDNDNYLEELQPVPFPLGDNVVKFPTVLAYGNFVQFSMPNRPLHNKIRFHYLYIDYIDHSVLAFLRSNKPIWDRMGTKLTLWPYKTEYNDQPIWEFFVREIWPIFATNIRHLSFDDGDYLDKLRRHTSPTILTDLDQLNAIDSGRLSPEGIADFEVLNPTAAQALTKWLHTPSKNGQPKRLYRNGFSDPLNLEWINNFKEAFRRATTSVSYTIQLYFFATTMPIEPFELVNERTNEKLTLKQKTEASSNENYNWLLKRCPIGETVTVPEVKWQDSVNPSANLNNIIFDLWSFNKSIGPLSPPAEEEEDEADQSNKNIV